MRRGLAWQGEEIREDGREMKSNERKVKKEQNEENKETKTPSIRKIG